MLSSTVTGQSGGVHVSGCACSRLPSTFMLRLSADRCLFASSARSTRNSWHRKTLAKQQQQHRAAAGHRTTLIHGQRKGKGLVMKTCMCVGRGTYTLLHIAQQWFLHLLRSMPHPCDMLLCLDVQDELGTAGDTVRNISWYSAQYLGLVPDACS